MIFGGFSAEHERLRPEGAAYISPNSSTWKLTGAPVRYVETRDGNRRVLVLGTCGATSAELSRLADAGLPVDVSWRWPGTYAIVEESPHRVVLHTDPAAALPLYATPWRGRWAWSSSARMLARLTSASIDIRRLACSVLAPSVSALTGSRTFFAGIEQLPPGSLIELPGDSGRPQCTVRWRPEPVSGDPHLRLRDVLTKAVALRVRCDPDLSCDLSGGLDSTTLAVLAANALPGSRPLNAMTVHPEGDTEGADLHYARLTAAEHPDRISHHLVPLGPKHLPYTRITDVPATGEPAPSTLTRARLSAQFHWMRQHLDGRTHLTGDGGDSVLFQPPAHLADLIRHQKWRRAVTEALGWARLRHTAVAPLLRDAVVLARTNRRTALQDLARTIGSPGHDGLDRGNVRWFALRALPTWATPAARRFLLDAATEALDTEDALEGLDISVRVLVDEIREVARSATADTELAAACGITLHNPFLDPLIVDTLLRTTMDDRPPIHTYKPVLGRAMRHLLPSAVATRTTKGSFNADHYAGLRANLPDLLSLADGHLVTLGILEPDPFRRHLRQAAAGVPMSLATIEQALTAGAWLHAHRADPGPGWTTEPWRSAHV
ncbi:albusnodin/ikarugamycin family macrolactam cyclase [Streptomyces sp. NPDC057137]|uniref:albusnodin/ikarugamycin family macrolactam cyclase n=1 Tax=Streptomyces sp. NPDC057137 TaxID=3346030 RepID=UPI003630E6B2